MSDQIRDQLRKIAALAAVGVGGERDTAKALLDRLLAKHRLTMADLDDAQTSMVWFCATGEKRSFLIQIACKVCNSSSVSCSTSKSRIWMRLTRLQAVEVEQLMAVIWPAWLKEKRRTLKMLRMAFYARNHLHSDQPADDASDPNPLSAEDVELLRRLYLAQERVAVRKALKAA